MPLPSRFSCTIAVVIDCVWVGYHVAADAAVGRGVTVDSMLGGCSGLGWILRIY